MSATIASEPLPPLALLAGGLATRLRPATDTVPKSMILAAGEPFIAHQLRLLRRERIEDIVICIGHLGEQIKSFVGDGGRFGCRVRYTSDEGRPLGTGGALRQALPLLGTRFFVMYGDSYLDIAFEPIYQAFLRAGCPGLMTVFHNADRWDASNVEFVDGLVRRYEKATRTPAMHYIDYGIGVLSAGAVARWPADTPFDLAEIYQDLALRGQLAGYEVHDRFYEIGSPAGLAETTAYLMAQAQGRHP